MFRTALRDAAPADDDRSHPDPRRPGLFVGLPVLEVGSDALFPLHVLAVLPADLGKDRIVAQTAGVVRIRGVEAGRLVVGGVIIAEVVLLVSRPQEEMIGKTPRSITVAGE